MIGSSPTLYPPSPVCKLDRRHTGRLRMRDNLLTRGRGWRRSWIQRRESLDLCKTFTTLWMDCNVCPSLGIGEFMDEPSVFTGGLLCTLHNAHMPMHLIAQSCWTFGLKNAPMLLDILEIRVLSCSLIKCICSSGQSNWDHDKAILALVKITLTWFFHLYSKPRTVCWKRECFFCCPKLTDVYNVDKIQFNKYFNCARCNDLGQ
jgi:hypothetical protein